MWIFQSIRDSLELEMSCITLSFHNKNKNYFKSNQMSPIHFHKSQIGIDAKIIGDSNSAKPIVLETNDFYPE